MEPKEVLDLVWEIKKLAESRKGKAQFTSGFDSEGGRLSRVAEIAGRIIRETKYQPAD